MGMGPTKRSRLLGLVLDFVVFVVVNCPMSHQFLMFYAFSLVRNVREQSQDTYYTTQISAPVTLAPTEIVEVLE